MGRSSPRANAYHYPCAHCQSHSGGHSVSYSEIQAAGNNACSFAFTDTRPVAKSKRDLYDRDWSR